MAKKALFTAILFCSFTLALFVLPEGAVLIQSLESRTIDGDPVFNQIQFFSGRQRDIWMMNQSHHGLQAKENQWDRLAIVVDKTGDMKTAKFLQLPPGELKWSDELLKQGQEYRASCFLCHNNGPRAIRPDLQNLAVSMMDRLKISMWNLRIKTYGRILENQDHKVQDVLLKTPFRHRFPLDNETLKVSSCTKCHSEEGWVRRGALTRQQAGTIEFLVEKRLMPPPGFSISDADRNQIQKFVRGL